MPPAIQIVKKQHFALDRRESPEGLREVVAELIPREVPRGAAALAARHPRRAGTGRGDALEIRSTTQCQIRAVVVRPVADDRQQPCAEAGGVAIVETLECAQERVLTHILGLHRGPQLAERHGERGPVIPANQRLERHAIPPSGASNQGRILNIWVTVIHLGPSYGI